MTQYRSKPAVIEAEQFEAQGAKVPRGMKLWPDETGLQPRDMSWGYVDTTQGNRAHVHHEDYIVAEPDGNGFYPVKKSIFEARWEPVTASPHIPGV